MKHYASPTTTLDLEAAAQAHPILRRYFDGAYPLDALSTLSVVGRPRHLIYNLSPSTRPPGTHWISIWLGEDLSVEVVDSFGRRPTSPEVIGFIRRHGSQSRYAAKQIQNWTSNVCGLYCLSHGLARACGQPLSSWLDRYTKDLGGNDRAVQCEFMRELAFPSLFSPRLRHWRQAVARACSSISSAADAKRAGCRSSKNRAKKLTL